ncbi:MAG TPA: hypothetical protein VEI02_08795 [Planctomycetota bacterium]|nr:hypothetical protein [Planctomycetota bacterium]
MDARSDTLNRAGRYVAQTSGYRAFIPAPLPPEPQIALTPELATLLSAADRAIGKLDGSVLTLPNADLILLMWLAFFLRGVVEVADEAADTARRILQLRESLRAVIAERLGRAAGNGHKVLETLFDRPIVDVNDVMAVTDTSYAAANTLVARMAEAGVLSEMTGFARNRKFRFASYIALFNDGPV